MMAIGKLREYLTVAGILLGFWFFFNGADSPCLRGAVPTFVKEGATIAAVGPNEIWQGVDNHFAILPSAVDGSPGSHLVTFVRIPSFWAAFGLAPARFTRPELEERLSDAWDPFVMTWRVKTVRIVTEGAAGPGTDGMGDAERWGRNATLHTFRVCGKVLDAYPWKAAGDDPAPEVYHFLIRYGREG